MSVRKPAAKKVASAAAAAKPASEPVESTAPQRPVRKPFGMAREKLSYEPRPNYHRRWFNAVPGRIEAATEAGYTHVKDSQGKVVTRVVSRYENGDALSAYLMEIPEEFYQEDQAAKQAEVDQVDQAIRQETVNVTPDDNRYVPSQGISIKSGA